MRVDIKTVWKRLGKLDKAFLILLLFYIVLLLALPSNAFVTFLEFALFVLGAWLVLRLSRIALRKVIWRLRNRILVTYVFIAVVPILLIVALAGLGTYMLAGQVAVYLARSELDRRVSLMRTAVDALLHTNPAIRVEGLRRTGEIYSESFPNLLLMIVDSQGNVLHWPANPAIATPPELEKSASGVAVLQSHYYVWAQAEANGMRFIAATPLTRRYLSEMVPGLGDVYFLQISTAPAAGKSKGGGYQVNTTGLPSGREVPGAAVPPAVNRFDLDVRWVSLLPVKHWLEAEADDAALLLVHTRYSAILNIILSNKVDDFQGLVPIALLVISITFLVVELIALIIGVSLTRTVTGAVHSLYEGTQRVMHGDFSHRITVSGRDQLADLSKSFNSMTENLEKLLIVAKEKERLQAELALALEVQEQLYPKTAPIFKTIRVTGMCQPARMVSGDYYDYQKLSPSWLAFAIGDVAGKGISAALLMAGIQSAMRMELRGAFETGRGETKTGEMGTDLGPPSARANGFRLSTARLVSELNQQLHATTSPEKFATFCIALYDDETGMLTYTNAGHLPPILIHNGRSTPLDINGTVVGAFPSSKYDESKVELRAGDLLVCYTDGITEPENEYGEMFGEDRLIELVSKNADRDDHRVIEVVMDAVRQWTGSPELSDDMTVLLARKQ